MSDAPVGDTARDDSAPEGPAREGRATLTVVRPGLFSTVQDQGRAGLAYLGIPRSGAVDAPALRQANLLVGNDSDAAGLEFTLAGATLRPDTAVTVAVTGAPAPVQVDGRDVDLGRAVTVPAGAQISVGTARSGLRSYLAVSGGVAVTPVLGSRSTDTLSGLGPDKLKSGDTLPIGTPTGRGPAGGAAADPAVRREVSRAVTVRAHPGPRADWFDPAAVRTFFTEPYAVSPTSNRVGARLNGPALGRAVARELPSEGLVLGAVQVPASGEPLVFLADHPTTGGYPVIAVVDPADVPLVAQARPGTEVRFIPAGTTWTEALGGPQQ